jgi:hypothetical protein
MFCVTTRNAIFHGADNEESSVRIDQYSLKYTVRYRLNF